ncbi:MAG: hypothetical protein U9N82_05980 [Thermodesulfobacteriota bacterium]|nr:hypothetical protein [Thermodesulfobacteriota bacterium]
MHRCPYAAKALLLGLFTAQIIALIQVYLSNEHLYRTLVAINDAGYLAIPNQHIMHGLRKLGPAFFGGLFFTLSTGAGLSVASLSGAWIWDRLFSRNKFFLIPFLLVWTWCLLKVNSQGFCPIVTSYFFFIPGVVFITALISMPPIRRQRALLNLAIILIPIALLAVLWTGQMNKHIFLDLRDNLLLSNALGTRISDFYYEYTLYPAEAFKSLDQKILKTCDIGRINQKPVIQLLESRLLDHDYLNTGGGEVVDLEIIRDGNNLVFENNGRKILETTSNHFFLRPDKVLKEFSLKTDRYIFFRQFTYFSLLIGFPISLYVLLHAIFHFILGFFLDLRTAMVIASILCSLAGLSLLAPLYIINKDDININNLERILESETWQKRVAALKVIEEKRLEPVAFLDRDMLISPHIPERYWVARTLGFSRQPEAYKDLLILLDDPHFNVVSMALYSLGQKRDTRAIKEIIKKIQTSHDWYTQWYAYKALRALGWKQTRSK